LVTQKIEKQVARHTKNHPKTLLYTYFSLGNKIITHNEPLTLHKETRHTVNPAKLDLRSIIVKKHEEICPAHHCYTHSIAKITYELEGSKYHTKGKWNSLK